MAADWDSGGTCAGAADSGWAGEISTAADGSDWDTCPDHASDAAGDTPGIAHLNQGNPDSWGDYDPADYDEGGDEDDWGDGCPGTAGSDDDEEPGLWGGAYPGTALYDDGSKDTGSLDGKETPRLGGPAAGSATDNGRPGQATAGAADSEHARTPEQGQISALEAKLAGTEQQLADTRQRLAGTEQQLADTRQRLAGTEQQLAGTQQQIADLKARFEQMLADRGRQPDRPDVPAVATSEATHGAALSEHKDTGRGADPVDAAQHGWRSAVSSEKVGIAGSLVGAAGTVADFVTHVSPDGMIGMGATVLGLASLGLAQAEKRRKGERRHD